MRVRERERERELEFSSKEAEVSDWKRSWFLRIHCMEDF
jgi:hypothetical protein